MRLLGSEQCLLVLLVFLAAVSILSTQQETANG